MGAALKGNRTRRICSVKSVAIIGPNGQLGTDLVKTFTNSGWKVNPITHKEISVENLDSVSKALKENKSDWVINTAAFHKVDECEKDSEKAWLINTTGPQNIAQVANDLGSKVVFVSSDYVFSGNLPIGSSYEEDHSVSPLNAYGHSKAAGEIATLSVNGKNLVVRISSVFGSAGSSGKGGNFVETIINKAKNGDLLSVVNDVHMAPTYAVDASKIIHAALEANGCGRLHAANTGSASWFDFAYEILKLTGIKAQLSSTQSNWEQIPRRPKNSVLGGKRAFEILGKEYPWQDGLKRYLIENRYL